MDSILEYWDDSNVEGLPNPLDSSSYNQALYEVIDEFKAIKGLRLRDFTKTLENMKLSTNSGAPYFTRKRNVAQKVLAESKGLINQRLFSGKDYKAAVIG